MRALVLSGGGSKGIFQVGVLKSMLKKNPELDYDIYVGSSSGAINAYVLSKNSLNKSLPKLEQFWLTKASNSNIYGYKNILLSILILTILLTNLFFALSSSSYFCILFSLMSMISAIMLYRFLSTIYSIYDTSFLLNEIRADKDPIVKKLSVGAVRAVDGIFVNVKETSKHIKDFVAASAAFPLYFSPIEIDGQLYIDGGLVNLASIDEAIKRDATEIDVIICSKFSIPPKKVKNVFDIIFASLNIMSNEILINDICVKRNVVIRLYQPTFEVTKSVLDFDSKELLASYTLSQDENNVHKTILS
jgi:NTE family protein